MTDALPAPVNRFRDAKIYRIVNEQGFCLYIGSTLLSLNRRLSQHKGDSVKLSTGKRQLYEYVNRLPERWKTLRIELITLCPCENRAELNRAEGEHILRHNPPLNKRVAGRTAKEYEKHRSRLPQRRAYRLQWYYNKRAETLGISVDEYVNTRARAIRV